MYTLLAALALNISDLKSLNRQLYTRIQIRREPSNT